MYGDINVCIMGDLNYGKMNWEGIIDDSRFILKAELDDSLKQPFTKKIIVSDLEVRES